MVKPWISFRQYYCKEFSGAHSEILHYNFGMAKPIARIKWVTEKGTETYVLGPDAIVTLGREPGNDIIIPQGSISRTHARIEWIGNSYVLNDLGSANGTFVNGQRLGRAPWILKDGDKILLDVFPLRFEIVEEEEEPVSPPEPAVTTAEAEGEQGQQERLPQTMELHPTSLPEEDVTFIIQREPVPGYFSRNKFPRLIVSTGLDAGRTFDLTEPVMTIGYAKLGAAWEIQLNDASVSQPHAKIEKRGDTFWLIDLGSEKGSSLNGRAVKDPVFLAEGDVIVLGEARLIFRGG